jgi:hypothetical protein
MSGLNQQFTKLSSPNRLREFESHRLRIQNCMQFCAEASEQTALLVSEIRRPFVSFYEHSEIKNPKGVLKL